MPKCLVCGSKNTHAMNKKSGYPSSSLLKDRLLRRKTRLCATCGAFFDADNYQGGSDREGWT